MFIGGYELSREELEQYSKAASAAHETIYSTLVWPKDRNFYAMPSAYQQMMIEAVLRAEDKLPTRVQRVFP